MAQRNRRFKFEQAGLDGSIRLLSSIVDAKTFASGRKNITVNLARVMSFKDMFYGQVDLTRKKFNSFIKNFDENVYGQDVFIDVAHSPSDGAAATIRKMFMDGKKLRAEVEFTDFGVEAVEKRGFRYLSIDFTENYTDPESEKEHGPLLFGAGLTIRPRVKHLDPIQFSFDDDTQPFIASQQITMHLSQEINIMWEKIWKKLQEKLLSLKLSEGVLSQYSAQFEVIAKQLGDNEAGLQAVADSFLSTAKTLAESGGGSDNVKLDFSGLNVQSGMSTADMTKMLDERDAKQAKEKKELAEKRDTNVAAFNKLLDEAEGLSSLPEDQRTMLSEAGELITPEMSADQVTRLAEQQIKLGNQMAVSAQLSGMGFQAGGRQGSVHISLDESNNIKSLQESIIKGLKGTAQHSTGALILGEKTNPFVNKVLAEFDVIQAERLHAEHKMFAGESTGIADTNFPAGFQRTVIREALSDLNVLALINTLTDAAAQSTTEIPYETRDISALNNDGVVFEGQGIHRASIVQAMDTAYILPRKIAFLISNEVMHFSRASNIDWDAYARNVASNARYMRELIHRALCNEMQRSADSYLAADIANEGFDGQLTGAVSTIKTAQFPIVRAYQPRDLKGNNVGTAENTITVRLDGAAIAEFDGSGKQAAATYYRITNYNLGYVQFVNQLGVAVTPANAAGADDISYSYATNIVKFDTDNGATELGVHLNGLLRAIGGRKAVMSSDRFVTPDFMLMSSTVNDTCTNANQFEEANQKEGANLDSMGDLSRVKGVNAWKSDAPGVDLGDERILLGQRGTTGYTIAKPFVTGQPFEAVDSDGRATGQKQAYGEEYSAIKTPSPISKNYTSVIVYSATGR